MRRGGDVGSDGGEVEEAGEAEQQENLRQELETACRQVHGAVCADTLWADAPDAPKKISEVEAWAEEVSQNTNHKILDRVLKANGRKMGQRNKAEKIVELVKSLVAVP